MAHYEDITITANNSLKCILCDEIMENNNHVTESHMDNRKHKELYMKRLMARNSLFIRNAEVLCQLCSHSVKISGITHHIETTNHCRNLINIKEVIENDGKFTEISDGSSSIYCNICNNQMDYNIESVKAHIESDKHRRAKSMVLQPMNGIFSVEDSNEYLWCKLCQIFFDNYVELIFQHVEDSKHTKTMRKILRMIDGQNITIESYLQNLKQDTALCKRCDIQVPCNVDNLQSHINGKKHKDAKI